MASFLDEDAELFPNGPVHGAIRDTVIQGPLTDLQVLIWPMWKRRFIFAGLLVVLIAGLSLGWYLYCNFVSDKDLQDAISEADW